MKLQLFALFCFIAVVMSQNLKIEEITNDSQRCDLLEAPHWSIPSQSLYFVDIFGPTIFRYSFADGEIYKAKISDSDAPIGFITPLENRTDEFVIGLGKRLTVIKWDGKSEQATIVKAIGEVDSDFPSNRINDGKCDPHGRVFFGTMGDTNTNLKENPTGSLYRYDAAGESSIHLRGSIGIGNGLAWNEALGKFYYVDSVTRDVKVFDYDSSSGNISNEQVLVDFVKTHTEEFAPDGMTIDENGAIYVATWNGSRLMVIDPATKTIKKEITFPTAKITSAAFGGPNLDILYVTTAYHNGPKVGSAGGLFKVTGLGVKGLPMTNFKLY